MPDLPTLPTPEQERKQESVVAYEPMPLAHSDRKQFQNWIPWILRTPYMLGLCTIFIFVAISLEVMLHESDKRQGFGTPSVRLIHITTNQASQFLKSFVPALIFVPLLWLTREAYHEIMLLQPYVALSRGDSPPENSITMDYVSQSQIMVVISSFTRRHWGLTASSIVILWSALFPAFAGSLFIVRLTDVTSTNNVTLVGALGVNTNFLSTSATWIVAAGYVNPQLSGNPNLPPFVYLDVNDTTHGWMIPQFTVPQVPENVSLISDGTAYINVDTPLLNTQAECVPANVSNIFSDPGGNYNFSASLSSSCSETLSVTLPPGYSAWIDAFRLADPSCVFLINNTAPSIATDNTTATSPVVFAFTANGTMASAAFCYGYQRVFNATVKYDLRLGAIVSPLENVTYIPGHELEGYVLNGVDSSDGTGLALCDAMINNAGKLNSSSWGIDMIRQNQVLSESNASLAELVQNTFLRYLLVAANNVFVVSSGSTKEGTLHVQKFRIHAYPPVVHALAALCAVSGLLLLAGFIFYSQERRDLHLVGRPGTIGVVGAMLSSGYDTGMTRFPHTSDSHSLAAGPTTGDSQAHSTRASFLALLHPSDTNEEIKKKLKNKRFGLNRETGALEMVGDISDEMHPPPGDAPRDSKMSNE